METTFILKDVIYIVVGVASALGFYWKMVMSDKTQEEKIKQMKKEIDKNESIMFKKFSSVHARMDKNEESNKTELKSGDEKYFFPPKNPNIWTLEITSVY